MAAKVSAFPPDDRKLFGGDILLHSVSERIEVPRTHSPACVVLARTNSTTTSQPSDGRARQFWLTWQALWPISRPAGGGRGGSGHLDLSRLRAGSRPTGSRDRSLDRAATERARRDARFERVLTWLLGFTRFCQLLWLYASRYRRARCLHAEASGRFG